MHTSTWQHVPSGDTEVVVWLWSFSLELPHLPLISPRMMLDCPLGMSCVEEEPVFLCAHLLTARYPAGFLASVSGEVGCLERWRLPLAGDCCWNTHSPSTSATKTSFSCMLLPRLPVIKAEQPIRASA